MAITVLGGPFGPRPCSISWCCLLLPNASAIAKPAEAESRGPRALRERRKSCRVEILQRRLLPGAKRGDPSCGIGSALRCCCCFRPCHCRRCAARLGLSGRARELPAAADNGQPKHVTGSTRSYTEKDINDFLNPPDWFPEEHPRCRNWLRTARRRSSMPATQCHLTTGRGHPESGNLAGLPAGYIQEQIAEFRNGSRKSSLAGRSANMIMFASALTDDEVKEAAQYFASIKPAVWNKVVETTTVPKTYVGEGICVLPRRAMRRNRSAAASSKCRKTRRGRRSATRIRHSSPTCPPAASKPAKPLSPPAAPARPSNAPICHGADLKGIGQCPWARGTFGDLCLSPALRHPARHA